MKKLISVLLVLVLVLSISVCAFAADPEKEEEEVKQSPTQEVTPEPATTPSQPAAGGNDGGYYGGGQAAKANDDKAEKEAEAAEAEAAEGIEGLSAEGEDAGDEAGREASAADEGKEETAVGLWLGKKVGEGTEQMQKDWAALLKNLVSASAKLLKADAAKVIESIGDKAGAPFRAVASEYPVTVTIKAPANFAGIMAFANGKWSALDCTVDGDTVTFVLEQPSIFSVVTATETAP